VTKPISRYPVPDTADLPEDLRNVILGVQERTGFVPNVFLALSHRPDELRAFHEGVVVGKEGSQFVRSV